MTNGRQKFKKRWWFTFFNLGFLLYVLLTSSRSSVYNSSDKDGGNGKYDSLEFQWDSCIHFSDKDAAVLPIKRFDRWRMMMEVNTMFYSNSLRWYDLIAPFVQDFMSLSLDAKLDKSTVLQLAILSSNAYTLPNRSDWIPINDMLYSNYLTSTYNGTSPKENNYSFPLILNVSYGWDQPGLRGHVFKTKDDSVVIVAVKGTSPGFWGIGGDTAEIDRYHDNLFFSCCCAATVLKSPVCPCYLGYNSTSGKHMCSSKCMKKYAKEETYATSVLALHDYVKLVYPNSRIIFTGHSLGGALAAIASIRRGTEAVSMNAPAVKRYARNLFGSVPQENPVLHYGTEYDPIFTGKCNGRFSQCYLTAYAMDAVVHTGKICTFPKQGGDSWFDLRYHTISQFISKVLMPTLKMPECVEQKEEEECSTWEYH